jgi:hypothetical protein
MEQAFGANPELRRPRPDLAKLRASMVEPALRSIVTAPPVLERSGAAQQVTSAV